MPSLDFSSTEHELGRSGLQWSMEALYAGLSRVQPNFSTGGLTQRFDLHPEIVYPLSVRRMATAAVGGRAGDDLQPEPDRPLMYPEHCRWSCRVG